MIIQLLLRSVASSGEGTGGDELGGKIYIDTPRV